MDFVVHYVLPNKKSKNILLQFLSQRNAKTETGHKTRHGSNSTEQYTKHNKSALQDQYVLQNLVCNKYRLCT